MANKDGRPPVENPREKILGVRLTIEEHEHLKAYAKEHHKTLSEVVIESLNLLINKEESDK